MPTAIDLRNNILGWGADLDPRNRPGVPREKNNESVTEIRASDEYEKIPRQEPHVEILVSSEHNRLPPVFGTTCPPHGLSGILRRLAFRYSEGQKAHWAILLLADRVDVIESGLSNLLAGKSHNPLKEYGLGTEFRKGGFISRFGHDRADTKRLGQQSLIVLTILGASTLLLRRALKKAA